MRRAGPAAGFHVIENLRLESIGGAHSASCQDRDLN